MVTDTTIRKGYKQTDLGIIPDDWDVKKFVNIAMITRGASPRPIDSPIWFDDKSEIGWVRISDVTKSTKFLRQTTQKLSELGIKSSRFVGKGNLIMSICATVGRPILTELDVCIHDGFVVFADPKIGKDYLYYFLSFIEDDWSKNGQTGSQMNLNTGLINSTQIAFPKSKPEQTAIATILSNTDELIKYLGKVIAKKKAIKQGTMQQLLTGKKRLQGFNGRWEDRKLGDVSKIESGINKPLSFIGKKGTVYITVLELYEGSHIPADKAGRIDVSVDEIKQYSLQPGDIVFGKSSVKREGIGFPNIFIGYKEPAVFSGFTFRARMNSKLADPFYIIHVLRMPNTRNWLINNSQASALTNINQTIANNIPVYIPLDIKEQTAIATILSDMDTEIESLEQKRDKYSMLKQGMMQQLLTGKIRIYANN